MSVEDVRNHAFQPTRPLRGATRCPQFRRRISSDFNPRAPCGARRCKEYVRGSQCNYFNPRAPCGARREGRGRYQAAADISTHAPLAGRDASRPLQPMKRNSISTHAPLAGRDNTHIAIDKPLINFNPRAPCGARLSRCRCGIRSKNFNPRAPCGARPSSRSSMIAPSEFQPTRPLRGATGSPALSFPPCRYFNPRAPCGARPTDFKRCPNTFMISTHAPLAGRDLLFGFLRDIIQISTHAPLAGRDHGSERRSCCPTHFNPRAPCGARQQKCTNHYAHFCDNRQISDAFTQNAACQGILLLFDAGKPCGFWVRTAQVISAHLCFAL